uniref:probable disease resistance protein At4g27220 n=1 Tax=Erigeron canadensis TaxID=72917 RepID=UPI001CB966CA|nr:probable disease resistance protein At4g27220 [Erigeron canadensis]
MDFLSAIVGPVVESLLVPVKKHLGFLLSSEKHVSNMSTRMKKLHDTRVGVKGHMETNNRCNLEIPTGVLDWLEAVEKTEEDAERISSNVHGCFNLKKRYRTGRKAFKIAREIEGLIKDNTDTSWSDAPKPLGKVSSKKASTSAPSDGDDAHNFFNSRDKIFKEALGFLQQDHKAQVVALCGMGGVGKTTMMEQLKKAVEDKKMFDWVVKVVIGEKMNTFYIQQTVAEYLQIPLTETSTTARADRLRVTFGNISQERKQKVLVILDDVWEKAELKDIGLCPLPNGSKLLLTSRNENVCTQIVAEDDLDLRVVRVDVMEELEANNFFFHISKVSDPDLKEMGVKIVKRCGFLPLAIKLIATNLRSKEKWAWRNTLHRLKKNELDKNVQKIVEISYNFLADEDAKAVFLLCGLFPDDFNIPIEELTRFAWGLKLFNKVTTLGAARDRTKTCVGVLKNASLLMDSDHSECVKMHDLVLAFVVAKVSEGEDPWIIKHGDNVSEWSRAETTSESCTRISLTCMGMSEFPGDFNYPNVSLMRLMNGDKSLKFAENFYEKMENLQVMACEKLQYPLLPTSLQCSTTLRTLCLHKCSLMFDFSPIGDHLLNLEVLSFAHSGIKYLPSAIGNLVKLKLLDLTGCIDLRIDEGVLKNLVKLEELYMRVANKKGIKFTDTNYKELGERSKNLSALEVEFIENNPHSKNMLYNRLERFKISIGRYLERHDIVEDMHSSENTLMFKVANKDEVLESGMIELFSKTEVLYLEAGSGMNNLEEVLPKSVPRHSLFYNLRVLYIDNCVDMRYLFTVPVARGLVKLERLTIWNCPVMEALVYSEENGIEEIRFQGLTFLNLNNLPKLEGLSSNTNNIVIHLPQLVKLVLAGLPNLTSIYPAGEYKSSIMSSGSSTIIKPFFNKQAMIPPRLERLEIWRMEALKNIWPEVVDDATCCCSLRYISVVSCHNLVNVFPRNPMPLLPHLETIWVNGCGSIQPLFDIDVGEEGGGISKLRSIGVYNSERLTEVWRLKRGGAAVHINHPDNDDDVIICGCFQAVENIYIFNCKSFRNVFTPTTARFDLGALKIRINDRALKTHLVESLPDHIDTHLKPSIESPPQVELKELPSHLKYAFLGEEQTLPVIIASNLEEVQEKALLKVLKENKAAIGWTIADLKGISPSIVMHKIITNSEAKPSRDAQRRLNPHMREVVKKEVLKWLDAGIVYPISDSTWVSPTQTVPKKAGIQVVKGDSGEQIATRPITGWRVCIDYRKLNTATSKDHFPLSFIDQIIEKLAGECHSVCVMLQPPFKGV